MMGSGVHSFVIRKSETRIIQKQMERKFISNYYIPIRMSCQDHLISLPQKPQHTIQDNKQFVACRSNIFNSILDAKKQQIVTLNDENTFFYNIFILLGDTINNKIFSDCKISINIDFTRIFTYED